MTATSRAPRVPSTTDYSAMSYTLFSVPTLSSDLQDTPISQVVFLPFDATCIYDNGTSCGNQPSYTWFPTAATGTPTTVNGVPNIYHAWTSVLDTPAGNDTNLVDTTMPYNNGYGVNELSNTGTTTLYFRLEVDTLQWDRAQTCGSATCAKPEAYTNNSQSTAHKGYAVRLVAPGTSLICSQDNPPATSPPAACQTATMAAMGDMTVYTPIESGSTPSSFSIPLFQLDPSYANQYIDVDIFDIGDITFTGGPKTPTWASRSRAERPLPTTRSSRTWATRTRCKATHLSTPRGGRAPAVLRRLRAS